MRAIPTSRTGLRAGDLTVAAGLLLGLAALVGLMRPQAVTRSVRVVDGDTLVQGERRIRLAGLDAPELGQSCRRPAGTYPCGEAARSALRELIAGVAVTCTFSGQDRYGRSLGRCEAGRGDLGAALVASGWAVADGTYAFEEAAARLRGLGLWEGPFERPADWRHRQPGYHRP